MPASLPLPLMRYTHLASLALAVLVAGGCDSTDDATARQTASATIAPPTGITENGVSGTATFAQDGGELSVQLALTGATPGLHGFHIHTVGSCAPGPDPAGAVIPAGAAMGHYDPLGTTNHGAPTDSDNAKHAGDLGNVTAGADGRITATLRTDDMSLTGTNPVVGRAVMVHSGQDDLMTDPGGNSGTRVGCGVISAATTAN